MCLGAKSSTVQAQYKRSTSAVGLHDSSTVRHVRKTWIFVLY